jgi:GPH family glycoside/pentoside/hexuronide:cation symporter
MISFKEKVGYGFGDMSSSMFWKIFGMYLIFFYTNVYGLAPAAVGTMMFVTRIYDAAIDPVMGIISDRTHSRWGKYRPYLLWFAIPFAIAGILTFYTPRHLSGTGMLAYAYASYLLMMTVYTAINVPYASLLGVMSTVPAERNTLSSYRMFCAFIGSFITFMLFQPMTDFFSLRSGAKQTGWTLAVAAIGVLCVLLFLFCFKWTRERMPVRLAKNERVSVRGDLKDLCHDKPFWLLLFAGVAALLFNAIRDGVTLFYFADYIRIDFRTPHFGWTLATLYLLLGQAGNMLGILLTTPLSNRYGKRPTYMGAMAAAAVLSCCFFFINPRQIGLLFIFQGLTSVCAGYVLPLLWSMFADIADYQEWKTGRRTTGLIFSASSFSQKMGTALGAACIGWLLAFFGYKHSAVLQCASTISGIRAMMSWIPAIACLAALLAMAFYPLSEKKLKAISAELGKRRASLQIDNENGNR